MTELLPLVMPTPAGQLCQAFGDELTVKISGDQTNGAFALCSLVTPPGGGSPPHFHLHEDELFMLQEGRVAYRVDDQHIELSAGGVVFAPRGSVHTFRNLGDTPCRQWILTTPAGFEVFFARCAAEFARPGGPSRAELRRISAEHGIHSVENPGQ